MKILRDYREFPPAVRSSLTIGNFDGLHVGHRRILQEMVAAAQSTGTVSVLMTFSPHPLLVLHPESAPKLIGNDHDKIDRIRASGMDFLLIQDFNLDLSCLSGESFVREILVKHLRVKEVFVGQNFIFGHKRSGNVALLQTLGRECDYAVKVISPVTVRGSRVSSTWIRELIQTGRISMANRLLGRYFSIRGQVVAGKGLGRKLLFPTLNLQPDSELFPGKGVYVTRAAFEGQSYPAVTNVGTRPTVSGTGLVIETHLLHSDVASPPSLMEVQFLHRLRDEQKFSSIEVLKTQIGKDIQRASRFFGLFDRLHDCHPPKVPGRSR